MTPNLAKIVALAAALALAAGCSQAVEDPPQDGPEQVEIGTQQQALTCSAASADSCVLTSYEGYDIFRDTCSDNGNFYTTDTQADVCCSAGTSGCKYTGLRWQCVEWARRYMWKKWGPVWPGVVGASDMCASHPSGTKIVSKPVPGDVVVYGPGACLRKNSSGSCIGKAHGTYGHVGVVIGNPSSSKDRVKDQNGPQNAHNDYLKSAAKCYVHATANPRTCFSGATRTISDTACASGKAKQTCTSSHVWGSKTCVPADEDCTNDVIEGSEVCSGSNLDGKTCASEGFSGGTLACTCAGGAASLDTSQCYEDSDNDGVPDAEDVCPQVADVAQTDSDADGDGDACDPDLDGDGIANEEDNCPQVANADQADLDEDGAGDACDESPGNGGAGGGSWGGGGDNAGGSAGSGSGSGSGSAGQKSSVIVGDEGGCSVRAPKDRSSSSPLLVLAVVAWAASRVARRAPKPRSRPRV